MKDSLNALFERLKNGEIGAMAKIYELTHCAVFAVILGVLNDYQRSEDAMQETYIRIHQNIHSFTDNTKPINWILTVAKNTALSILRHEKYAVVKEDIDALADKQIDIADKLNNTIMLNTALKLLNETERQIVLLKTAGVRHKDIAKLLNKPIGTVAWSYSNSLKKMKKRLEE